MEEVGAGGEMFHLVEFIPACDAAEGLFGRPAVIGKALHRLS